MLCISAHQLDRSSISDAILFNYGDHGILLTLFGDRLATTNERQVHQGNFVTGDTITRLAYQSLKGVRPRTTP